MKKNEFKNDIKKFIEKSTCTYTCVKTISEILKKYGYIELKENNEWNLDNEKYYIIRNDASIICFEIPNNFKKSFAIITSHCDTPALLIKPNGAYIKENYLKINVMPYGGLLNYGWLDHPLSISGRIIINDNNGLQTQIVDFKKPLVIIPSVPIHQNEKANTNLDLNMQIDLQPIMTLSKSKDDWDSFLKKNLNGEIISYDLFLYNNYKPTYIGKRSELLVSPRIDNITSVYSSLIAFLEAKSQNIKVFCSFNNEEIGSLTMEGADSNFLIDILKRIAANINIDLPTALANSFVISSDNTHAIHPNHTEYADDTGVAYLNQGLAIVNEVNSTTNSISSSIIKSICDRHKIKYQNVTSKNDLSGGSTLSGISLRHVSILSIDVGVPELAMHSSIEVCSINDVYELFKMMKCFYELEIIKNDKFITFN